MENLLNQIFQLIAEWAHVVYNWLKNFIKIAWGHIQSYWPKIKEFVKDLLAEFEEVIIIDGREIMGKEILEYLNKQRPSEMINTDIDGIVTLSITENDTIAKIANLEASTEQEDQYDSQIHQNNGILRIKG